MQASPVPTLLRGLHIYTPAQCAPFLDGATATALLPSTTHCLWHTGAKRLACTARTAIHHVWEHMLRCGPQIPQDPPPATTERTPSLQPHGAHVAHLHGCRQKHAGGRRVTKVHLGCFVDCVIAYLPTPLPGVLEKEPVCLPACSMSPLAAQAGAPRPQPCNKANDDTFLPRPCPALPIPHSPQRPSVTLNVYRPPAHAATRQRRQWRVQPHPGRRPAA